MTEQEFWELLNKRKDLQLVIQNWIMMNGGKIETVGMFSVKYDAKTGLLDISKIFDVGEDGGEAHIQFYVKPKEIK